MGRHRIEFPYPTCNSISFVHTAEAAGPYVLNACIRCRRGVEPGTFGCGWVLAWLYKRLHPHLAFYKLWAFWSAILGGVVALLIAFGVVRM
jgi:hypothetical protein